MLGAVYCLVSQGPVIAQAEQVEEGGSRHSFLTILQDGDTLDTEKRLQYKIIWSFLLILWGYSRQQILHYVCIFSALQDQEKMLRV